MCKREFCEQIIALVAKITDLTVADIMSHARRPEIVDARYLAVYVMLKKGVQGTSQGRHKGGIHRDAWRKALDMQGGIWQR